MEENWEEEGKRLLHKQTHQHTMCMTSGAGFTAQRDHTFVYLTSPSGGSGAPGCAPAQQLQLSLEQGAPQVLFLCGSCCWASALPSVVVPIGNSQETR